MTKSGEEVAARSTPEVSDADLVERYQQGDQDAATELHRRHVSWLLAMVRNMVRDSAARSAWDDEGYVNSGFRSFFSYVGKPTFDARHWQIGKLLTKIVKRKCLKALRRTPPPICRAPDDLALTMDLLVACQGDGRAAGEVVDEVTGAIGRAAAALTARQRQIVALVYDEHDLRSLDDVALSCKCSLASVEDAIGELESRLRRELKSQRE